MSFKRRASAPAKCPVGPDGEPTCKCGCGGKIGKGRRSWSSQECVDKWKIANDPKTVRFLLLNRDHGVCAICGRDAIRARKRHQATQERVIWYRWAPTNRRRHWRDGRVVSRWNLTWPAHFKRAKEAGRKRALLMKLDGWPTHIATSWWEADHIVPVSEGGGQPQMLDAYRTLCWGCHRTETEKLRERLRDRRTTG